MVTPAARREAVTILVETYEMSERRACQVIGADRSSVRYASRRPDDTALRERMKEVAHDRRRFGYRRVHVLLKAEGLVVNRKKTERLYREEGLKVRRRRGRRRAMGTRAPIPVIARANARWSLDFVHDQLSCGRRFRVLNIVDDVTKECLGAIADVSLSGRRVIRELDHIISRRGAPEMIVSDNVLHSDTQASSGRRSSSRNFQIRALKSIAGWASATMEELAAIANTGSMRSVVAGPHRP